MLNFNGVDIQNYFGGKFRVISVSGRGLMSQEVNRVSVPGRAGSYYQSKRRPERIIEATVKFRVSSLEDMRQKVDELNAILHVDEPAPFYFTDEPDKLYYGTLSGKPDWDETNYIAQGVLTFLCPDPDGQGVERTQTINDPNNPAGANATVTNGGTAETKPVFRATMLKATPFFAIISPDNYIQLGKPDTAENPAVAEKELILRDEMLSLANWQTGSYIENGSIEGSMFATDSHFKASSFGTSTTGWHGPALEQALSEALQDFEVDFYLANISGKPVAIGRVEVYLLDAGNNVVAKASIVDEHKDYILNRGYIRVGSQYIINENNRLWNNFDGMIHIERVGNRWLLGIGQITDDGVHHSRHYERWIDYDNVVTAPVAKVEIHIGQFEEYSVPDLWHGAVYMYKRNQLTDDQIPYILQPDDEVVIDHKSRKILVNGQDARNLKYFPSNYFDLEPGQTDLAVSPADAAVVNVTYREAWL